MNTPLRNPLLLRVGLAMATITMLAFIGMLSSVFIAEITQGAASAINQAGSLRAQGYRIALELVYFQNNNTDTATDKIEAQLNKFESILLSPHIANVAHPKRQLRSAYTALEQQWAQTIKPMIRSPVSTDEMQKQQNIAVTHNYLSIVDNFVADINRFVKLLEEDAESKITYLKLIQYVILFSTLGVVFFTMYLMHTRVLNPLLDLLGGANAARRGDFSVRVKHTADDELGQLGYAFNLMAEDLSKMYKDLQIRVQEKTSDLERSNRSLELLYKTITRLYSGPVSPDTYMTLLKDIEELFGTGHGSTCVVEGDCDKARLLASTFKPGQEETSICDMSSCHECLCNGTVRIRDLTNTKRAVTLPLRDAERQYGVLQLELPANKDLDPWQMELLEALCRHIGTAMGTQYRTEQKRRLSLLEERTIIARELHDSLAQSLAYMKIQVSRLALALGNQANNEDAQTILGELRTGLNNSYRELRELLTTFRLKISGEGFVPALNQTVEEYAERGNIPITCTTELAECHLTPDEEIHVMQIVREALSNVVRHAKASHATVSVTCNTHGLIEVSIDDDGIGIADTGKNEHHYGLTIMQERARGLGGTLTVTRRDNGGTRVLVKFNTSLRTTASVA